MCLQERRERYLLQHQQASVELRIDNENVVQIISNFQKEVASLYSEKYQFYKIFRFQDF